MSRTDKDRPASKGGKWAMWMRPWNNEHAPSSWKRDQRRTERTKARQSIRNRREPVPAYHRPYFW